MASPKAQQMSGLKWRKVKDAPAIYANSISARVSLYDIALRLGHVTTGDDDELFVEEVGTIILSPQHAKALSRVLEKQVRDYEAEYGEIRLPAPTPSEYDE